MGGSEHVGGYGGLYPPGGSDPPYPPQPGEYRSYPPYEATGYPSRAAYPPPPPGEPEEHHDHHHWHHHEGDYDHGHQHHEDSFHHHHHGHHHDHHHNRHEEEYAPYPPRSLPSGQLVKVYCQSNPDYQLAVRHDGVVLVPHNHSDEAQQWIKDMSWGTRVKDEKGFPAFALINKATGQALKHAPGEMQQVLLADYNPSAIDESVLWTESEDMGNGFRTVRMANNIKLNLDAFRGDRKSGGIKEGTPAILFKWKKQENQLWKIAPV